MGKSLANCRDTEALSMEINQITEFSLCLCGELLRGIGV